ncbi:MAG: YHS domain-containing (seleno)protein [Devosia sp.]
MMRQTGKQILTILGWLLLAAAARADSLVTAIVTDPLTGVALEGYDPLTYFIEAEPRQGAPEYEYEWGGVPWYFVSAANRDIFARNPESYAPQYGGHCLMSLSRGFLSDGQPRLYVVEALKLYLFYSTANREAFLLSKREALDTAAANWTKLSNSLSGVSKETPVADALPSGEGGASSVAPDNSEANVQQH